MSYEVTDQYNIREKLMPYLADGESIKWVGQPDPTKLVSSADWFIIPFSLFWCGFAVFWEAMALKGILSSRDETPFPWIFPLFGIPFVLVGLYMLFGRFIAKRYMRQRTYYVVTNQRVLSLVEFFKPRVNSLFLSALPTINVSSEGPGTGSLIFMTQIGNRGNQMGFDTGMDFMSQNSLGLVGFFDIHDVQSVAALILKLRKEK
ncbi:MAG: hypothetical protein ACYC1M_00245 [Armatimonadota bacterium]